MKRVLLAFTFVSMLAGCGGGGGSPSSSSSSTPTAATTTVTGVASKGLIRQASVLVCRITNGAPEPDASCASGTTGSDGSYTVTLAEGHSGPAIVKIVAAQGSMMTDGITGADVPYTMTMRAVVPSLSANTTVYVTPFSEMAAQGATLSMPMDATTIGQANDAVENLMTAFGIDLGVMPLVNLRDNGSDAATLGRQANMVKQLARVALAAKNSNLMVDTSGVPCNAAGTAAPQQFACAVGYMARVMTSYVTADHTRATAMTTALDAQNPTAVEMPMRLADGTVVLQTTDMTSQMSIQSAMQAGGMTATMAANTANRMMGQMMM